jgi:hypothetical protein
MADKTLLQTGDLRFEAGEGGAYCYGGLNGALRVERVAYVSFQYQGTTQRRDVSEIEFLENLFQAVTFALAKPGTEQRVTLLEHQETLHLVRVGRDLRVCIRPGPPEFAIDALTCLEDVHAAFLAAIEVAAREGRLTDPQARRVSSAFTFMLRGDVTSRSPVIRLTVEDPPPDGQEG